MTASSFGKNDYQPSGPGTITRITAHQVEVLWEDETARRYRRAQLHNLRHAKLICELHGEWSAMFIDGVRESMAGADSCRTCVESRSVECGVALAGQVTSDLSAAPNHLC